VVAVDPLAWRLEEARRRFDGAGLGGLFETRAGVIEAIPAADAEFALVLCRDLVTLIEDLPSAFQECRRVLEPGGAMLLYAAFATRALVPLEAAGMHAALGDAPTSLERSHVERCLAAAGFAIERREIIGSEWSEFRQEHGRPDAPSRSLLRISRLRRARQRWVESYGEEAYERRRSRAHVAGLHHARQAGADGLSAATGRRCRLTPRVRSRETPARWFPRLPWSARPRAWSSRTRAGSC
jgi:SAM-dependent methyltransferase